MARYTLPLAPAFAVAGGRVECVRCSITRDGGRTAARAATCVVVARHRPVCAGVHEHLQGDGRAFRRHRAISQSTVATGSRILVEPLSRHSSDRDLPASIRTSTATMSSGAPGGNGTTTYSLYTLDAYVYLYGGAGDSRHRSGTTFSPGSISSTTSSSTISTRSSISTCRTPTTASSEALLRRPVRRPARVRPDRHLQGLPFAVRHAQSTTMRPNCPLRMNDHPRVYLFMRRVPRPHQ
mgnify:CR=1 FL=1